MCMTICNCSVKGGQVYTECPAIDKGNANTEQDRAANTTPMNSIVFERQHNKA